jgi:hypothetical protein
VDVTRRKNGEFRRSLGRIWADVTYAQQRMSELNRPWLRPRRRQPGEL